MKTPYFLIFIVIFINIVLSSNTYSYEITPLDSSQRDDLAFHVDYILDNNNAINSDDITRVQNWQAIDNQTINFGFIDSALWLRITAKPTIENEYFLYIPYPLIDTLDNHSFINGQRLKSIETGDSRPFETRIESQPYFVFPYDLKVNDELTTYLKIETSGATAVPLQFLSKHSYYEIHETNLLFRGVVCGVLILLILYNLFIYLGIRDKLYLVYVVHVSACLIASLIFDGSGFEWFWPNSPEINNILYSFFNSFIQVTSILLIMQLLNLFINKTWYATYFKLLLIVSILTALSSFFAPYSVIISVSLLLAVIVNASGLIVSVILSIKGNRSAQFFTVGIFFFLIGLIISGLKTIGFLPSNIITQYSVQIGFLMQMAVLALALTQRLDASRKSMIEAQKESIINLNLYKNLYNDSLSGNFQIKENGELLSANKAFCKILGYNSLEELAHEDRYKNITDALVNPNVPNEIKNIIEMDRRIIDFEYEIKDINNKIVWVSISMRPIKNQHDTTEIYEGSMINVSERKTNEALKNKANVDKMHSIEQLVVGICHELNTPLGLSITGLSHLKGLVTNLENSYENNTLTKKIFSDSIKSEYEAINITEFNLQRSIELIKQFKQVSVKQLGYERSMQDVLTAIENGLAYHYDNINNLGININIDYQGEAKLQIYQSAITEIINQLVANSCDHAFSSVEDKNINIKVEADSKKINIHYSDNGIGLSEQGKLDLFNPFYTTMRGDKGKTGLGLYVVYNLVTQLMSGKIELQDQDSGVEIHATIRVV